jgi:hypothetical protein
VLVRPTFASASLTVGPRKMLRRISARPIYGRSRKGPDEGPNQVHGQAQDTRPKHLLLRKRLEVMAQEQMAHLVGENSRLKNDG